MLDKMSENMNRAEGEDKDANKKEAQQAESKEKPKEPENPVSAGPKQNEATNQAEPANDEIVNHQQVDGGTGAASQSN